MCQPEVVISGNAEQGLSRRQGCGLQMRVHTIALAAQMYLCV